MNLEIWRTRANCAYQLSMDMSLWTCPGGVTLNQDGLTGWDKGHGFSSICAHVLNLCLGISSRTLMSPNTRQPITDHLTVLIIALRCRLFHSIKQSTKCSTPSYKYRTIFILFLYYYLYIYMFRYVQHYAFAVPQEDLDDINTWTSGLWVLENNAFFFFFFN